MIERCIFLSAFQQKVHLRYFINSYFEENGRKSCLSHVFTIRYEGLKKKINSMKSLFVKVRIWRTIIFVIIFCEYLSICEINKHLEFAPVYHGKSKKCLFNAEQCVCYHLLMIVKLNKNNRMRFDRLYSIYKPNTAASVPKSPLANY